MKRNKIAPFQIQSARLTPDGTLLFQHPSLGWEACDHQGHQVPVPELWNTEAGSSRLMKVRLEKPVWFKPRASEASDSEPIFVGHRRAPSGAREYFYAKKFGEEAVTFYSESIEKLVVPLNRVEPFIEFEIKVTRAITWREVLQEWGDISFTRKLGLSLAAAKVRGDLVKHRPLRAEYVEWWSMHGSSAFYDVNPYGIKELVEAVVPRFFAEGGLVTEIEGRESLVERVLFEHSHKQEKPAPAPVAELPMQGGRRRVRG